jgi:hypothetical protein
MKSLSSLTQKLSPTAAAAAPATPDPAGDPQLIAQRDRLTERFAILQSELGGAFYEMAIRDHVRLDALMRRAAELQRVDTELAAIERLIQSRDASFGGNCPSCGAVYARGAAFCAQCATALSVP